MSTAATNTQKRKRSRWRGWIIGIVVVLVLIGAGGFLAVRAASQAASLTPSGWQTVTAETGTIDASVSATGSVEPQAQAELRFSANGTVAEVYVKPGETVTQGQALAKIDDTSLRLALQRAQTDLQQAEIDFQKLGDGPTDPEVAAAKARLAQAQAQLRQTQGSVTAADVAAARAKLDAAKARLASLQSGFTDQNSSQADLDKAQTLLQSRRDELSQTKTTAKLALDQAVNDLTRAQSAYGTASRYWQHVQDYGTDPLNPGTYNSKGERVDNKLTEAQRQKYYDDYVQAEVGLRNAENGVQKAQLAYEQARQAEATGVQSAEQDVEVARRKLGQQQAGGANSQLASARAEVQSAQAELDRLTGTNRSGSLASSQAGVASAQADLEKLNAKPSENTLAGGQVAIDRAQVALKQAQFDLDQAVLKAPFAGTVARVDLRVGEPATGTVGSGSDARNTGVVVVDLSEFQVKVPVDELDVARVKAEQTVRLSFDALPEQVLTGTVQLIEPLATRSSQGTTTYEVTVAFAAGKAPVLAGMTASVAIVTEQKTGVVLVPRRAVQSESGKSYVLVPKEGPVDPVTRAPANERREVTLGLSNAEQIEIVSGLKAGEQVLIQDTVSTFNPVGG